jgi:hypothetical protein
VIEAVTAEVPAYARPDDAAMQLTLREGVRVALERLIDLLGTGDEPLGPAAGVYERIGAAEYGSHRPLQAVLAAYRVGALATWRGFSGLSAVAGTDALQTARLAEACFAYIDEISAVSAAGYARAQSADAGRREARRAELVAAIVDPAGAIQVTGLAADLGWQIPQELSIAVWDDPELPDDLVAARYAGLTVAILTGPANSAAQRRLGRLKPAIGSAQPLAQAPASYRHALLLHRLRPTGALPATGPILAVEHLPLLVIADDEQLAAALIARALAPLDGMAAPRRASVVDTTAAWLLHGGSRSAVAGDLHIHPQTVAYRMTAIRELFGDQLASAEQRWELLLALRAEQVLRLSR